MSGGELMESVSSILTVIIGGGLGLIFGVGFVIFGIWVIFSCYKLLFLIGCMSFLPPGHRLNVMERCKCWQEAHPGKKHPFKY